MGEGAGGRACVLYTGINHVAPHMYAYACKNSSECVRMIISYFIRV
jgi:hypothetical protein